MDIQSLDCLHHFFDSQYPSYKVKTLISTRYFLDAIIMRIIALLNLIANIYMKINIKTKQDIDKIRIAGYGATSVLKMIEPHIQAGVTTEHLNTLCHDYIVNELKGIPATLNYHGFPKSICTSLNHVICHGIPGAKKLKNGDIINVDVTVIKDGYFGDTSRMFYVGEPSILARRLCDVTKESMIKAIELVKPGATTGDIGAAIQQYAEAQGFSVVREYCGHGIGKSFHEDPQILHYGQKGQGIALKAGMVFTIEPMINAGKKETRLLGDQWTVVTADHSLSAQWEHTIAVTKDGFEALTCHPGDAL